MNLNPNYFNILFATAMAIGSLVSPPALADTENHKDHCARRAQQYAKEQEQRVIAELNEDGRDYSVVNLQSDRVVEGVLRIDGSVDTYLVEVIAEDDFGSYKAVYTLDMKRHVGGRSCRVEEEKARFEQFLN